MSSSTTDTQVTLKKDEEPSAPSAKRPFHGKKGPPQKRQRFNAPTSTSYQRISLPLSIVTQPSKKYFSIHTATKNFDTFVSNVYSVMIRRDFRLERSLSLIDMRYASIIAMNYRLISVGMKAGYFLPTYNISRLKAAAESVSLPDMIAKAIECVGSVTLPSGMTIVPYVPTDEEMVTHADYVHPKTLVIPGEGVVPAANQLFYDGAINIGRITDYTASSTRGLKSGFVLRKVLFDNCEGRIEFSVATKNYDSEVEAKTVFQMEEAVAHLGAAYGFRRLENRAEWLGADNDYLSYTCRSSPIEPALFTVERVALSLSSIPGK